MTPHKSNLRFDQIIARRMHVVVRITILILVSYLSQRCVLAILSELYVSLSTADISIEVNILFIISFEYF